MKNCAQYIAECKGVLGPRTSDQGLGDELGFAQQTIAQSKSGRMSTPVAIAVGEFLKKHGLIEHPGEVVLVALAERDANPLVRKTLADYAKNVLGKLPEKVGGAIGALLMAACLALQPQPSLAHDLGGEGRF